MSSGTETPRETKLPTNQTQMKIYLGSCDIYRRFVKNFAKTADPLTDLLKRFLPFQLLLPLSQKQMQRFNSLPEVLLKLLVLRLPRLGVSYLFDVDASKAELGSTLLQKQADDYLHPVGYWSRTMTDTQRNYTTTEKECLAVF